MLNGRLGSTMWPYNDVKNHWDEIEIRSFVFKDRSEFYQEGTLHELLPLETLV